MTQHQMRNIGNGNQPDEPLTYKVEYKLDRLICWLQAYVPARSEEAAIGWGKRMFGTSQVRVTLL
jgi:hypothetical protein